jgi:hypothetical protein
MSEPGNIPLTGQELATELAISQFVIPAGAGATFSASNNIATITFNAAHGLTMTPAAGVPPNYFIGFGGSTSGLSGTGILVGNVFRILTIPSTTAITIFTSITAATVTSLTGIPVFFPPFIAGTVSGIATGSPTQTISSVVTSEPFPILGYAEFIALMGANAAVVYNPAQTFAGALDASTTPLSAGVYSTPATAPVWKTLVAASATMQVDGAYPWLAIFANGTTATSYISCHV